MSSIVTSKYRTDDAQLFLDNVNSNNYYLFVSTLNRYDVNNSEYYKITQIKEIQRQDGLLIYVEKLQQT